MTPEEEIAAFNKSIGVKEAPVTHSGTEPGAGAKPAAAPGPPGGQMLDLSGLPFMERLKALATGGASLPPDHPARQPIDQGQDLEGPGVMGAKAADAISMGLLPYARDKIAEATGAPSNMRERIKTGAEANPWWAAGGTALGTAPLLAAGTAGVVRGARAVGVPWLGRAGVAPMAAAGAATGGLVSAADQGMRTDLTEENHDFNLGKVGFDAGAGGVGGVTGSLIGRAVNPVRSAIRSRLDPVKAALPTARPDPTGTIPPVRITGPEAMQDAGVGAGQVQQAQGLLDASLPKGAVAPVVAGREAALARGQEVRDLAVEGMLGRSAAAGEPAKRMPGAMYGAPKADPLWKDIAGTQGRPGGIVNAKDSGEAMLRTLEQLKANRTITPPEGRSALEDQIARLEANLSQPGRAPIGVQAGQAADRAGEYANFRAGFRPPAGPPPTQGPGPVANVAHEAVSLAADAAVPGAGSTYRLLRPLLGQNPTVPGSAPNEAVARALQDPAQLQHFLSPETFLELLRRDLPSRLLQQGTRETGNQALFGDTRTRDRQDRWAR